MDHLLILRLNKLEVLAGSQTKLREESINKTKKIRKGNGWLVYFSGTYIDERDAPIPGVPWRTGLLVIANSPR